MSPSVFRKAGTVKKAIDAAAVVDIKPPTEAPPQPEPVSKPRADFETPVFAIAKPKAASVHTNILFYAKPGTGKTVLSGSAAEDPRSSPVLFMDAEAGTLSLAGKPNIDVVRIVNFASDVGAVYEYLARGNHPYKTVVIDSLTEMQKLSMMDIMSQLVAIKPDRDQDIPSLQEWGKNIEQIRKFVRYFRDLPMHCIFTCLEMESKDESTGSITVLPSLSGKLAMEVSGFVDVVGRLYTSPVTGADGKAAIERRLLVQPAGKYVAKDRSGKLGLELVNPTFKAILDGINS